MIDLGPIKRVFSEIRGIASEIIALGIALLLVGAVFNQFGIRIPYLPTVDAYPLMLTAAAFWLYQGKSLK